MVNKSEKKQRNLKKYKRLEKSSLFAIIEVYTKFIL